MQTVFIPSDIGTHYRLANNERGNLIEYADTVQILPQSVVLASTDGFAAWPPPDPPAPIPVPDAIANWRAKAVLKLHNLLTPVETALNALPEPQKTVALTAWEGNADFVRNGPTVLSLAQTLSLTDEQVDAMFIQAAALEV